MIPDIYINDVSMLSLDLIRESIDFPVPKAQMETVIVPGRNSLLKSLFLFFGRKDMHKL